jgi:DNA-binding NtrC family response regulator
MNNIKSRLNAITSLGEDRANINCEDFHGFLTADNITIKMLNRAKKCAENNSKIIWIDGDIGVGKNLLAQAIIKQYAKLKHITHNYKVTKITQLQFDNLQQFIMQDVLLVPICDDVGKDCLIKLQQQLINILQQSQNRPELIIILSYPTSTYSASTAKQIANMRQIFINQQYQYLLLQPLRNRLKDIDLLGKNYLCQFAEMLNISPSAQIEEAILSNIDIFLNYQWQYNVKELQQYCLPICQMLGFMPLERNLMLQALSMINANNNQENSPLNTLNPYLINNKNIQIIGNIDVSISLLKLDGSMKQFSELEQEIINKACRYYRGSKTTAARELGVGRTTLYRKLINED